MGRSGPKEPNPYLPRYSMKPILVRSGLAKLHAVAACLIISAGSAPAANLLLDFGPTVVSTSYLTLSPGHDTGAVSADETSWNQITSSAQVAALNWSDGTSATGVTLTMGQGAKASSTITYSTAATFTGSIPGNGGAAVNQEKLTTSKGTSIYGPAADSTAVSLDALFASTNDTAIGFRIDGLAAGNYIIYAMARNTNTNAATGTGTNLYAAAGVSSPSFNYSSLAAASQTNPGYAAAGYVNEYGSFIDGENYVAIPLTVGEDQSVFLGVEGQGTAGSGRGFINMIQIVQVPEPSVTLLGALGALGLLRRRRD